MWWLCYTEENIWLAWCGSCEPFRKVMRMVLAQSTLYEGSVNGLIWVEIMSPGLYQFFLYDHHMIIETQIDLT